MMIQAEVLVAQVAHELEIPKEEVVVRGLRALLERDLRQIEAQIFEISGRYNVRSVGEMNTRYEAGTLEENGSWRDYQRLDHLEYKRDRLLDLLKELL